MEPNDEASEFAWRVHAYINDYIKFADAKAGALIGLTTVLLGVLIDQARQPGAIEDQWLFVAAVVFNAATLVLSILVVWPRRTVPLKTVWILREVLALLPPLKWRRTSTSLIFWEDVRAVEKPIYIQKVANLSRQAAVEEVAGHVHDLATVSGSKYDFLRVAFLLASIGLVTTLLWLKLN